MGARGTTKIKIAVGAFRELAETQPFYLIAKTLDVSIRHVRDFARTHGIIPRFSSIPGTKTETDYVARRALEGASITDISREMRRSQDFVSRRVNSPKIEAMLNRSKIAKLIRFPRPTTTVEKALAGRTFDQLKIRPGRPLDGAAVKAHFTDVHCGTAGGLCLEA